MFDLLLAIQHEPALYAQDFPIAFSFNQIKARYEGAPLLSTSRDDLRSLVASCFFPNDSVIRIVFPF